MTNRAVTWLAIAILAWQVPAVAQDEPPEDNEELVEEVLVWGRAIDLVGAADSASEGIVGYDDLTTRP